LRRKLYLQASETVLAFFLQLLGHEARVPKSAAPSDPRIQERGDILLDIYSEKLREAFSLVEWEEQELLWLHRTLHEHMDDSHFRLYLDLLRRLKPRLTKEMYSSLSVLVS